MSADRQRRWRHPIFVDLTDIPVIVIGGGTVAARKIETLIESGARVTVVSPAVTDLIAGLAEADRLTLRKRPYRRGDLEGFRLAYAATSDPDVNRTVREEAQAAAIWLNAVDEPALCDFITPAIVRRGNLTIAISPTAAVQSSPGRSGRISIVSSGRSTRTSSNDWANFGTARRPRRARLPKAPYTGTVRQASRSPPGTMLMSTPGAGLAPSAVSR